MDENRTPTSSAGDPARPVLPPVRPLATALPLGDLTWEQFEALCEELVRTRDDIEHVSRYGVPGQQQAGIDIWARRKDGGLAVFQCKRIARMDQRRLREAVGLAVANWSNADEVHLYVSSDLRAVTLQDAIRELTDSRDSAPHVVIWGLHEISRSLRQNHQLVRTFFGDAWASAFCHVPPDEPPRGSYASPFLPAAAPLLGREDLIARSAQLLQESRSRWMSVTGPPGVGKSSFALAVAHEIQPKYSVVHSLDLRESVMSGPLSLEVLLEIVGTSLRLGAVSATSVAEYLRGERSVLLVLDNAESLADSISLTQAGELLRRLLAAVPELTLMTTCPVAFGQPDEQVLAVGPLDGPGIAPEPDQALTVREIANSPSGALLLRQLRRADPELLVEEDRAPLLVQELSTADGLPLAIELSALSLSRQLRSGSDVAPVMDATRWTALSVSISRALALLEPDDAMGLSVAALYPSTFGRDSFAAIYTSTDAVLRSASQCLDHLVASHLVQFEHGSSNDGPGRYRVLSSIKAEVLSRIPLKELQALEIRFATHIAERFEEIDSALRGSAQLEAFELAAGEIANLAEAMRICANSAGPKDIDQRLVLASAYYLWIRGPRALSVSWLEQVSQRPQGPWAARGLMEAYRGRLLTSLGDPDGGARRIREAERLCRLRVWRRPRRRDLWWQCRALAIVASSAASAGNLMAAESSANQARRIAEKLGDLWLLSVCENLIGEIERRRGGSGLENYRRSLALGRADGDIQNDGLVSFNIGQALLAADKRTEAADYFGDAVRNSLMVRDWRRLAGAIEGVASCLSSLEHAEAVARLYGASASIRSRTQVEDLSDLDRATRDVYLDGTKALLGAEQFELMFQQGMHWPAEKAADHALRWMADGVERQ